MLDNGRFVNKFEEGKQLKVVYIVETTRHDEEMDINFSNITEKTCYSLNDALYIVNQWQNAGYKNISVMTQVLNELDNRVLIEDGAYNLDLKVNNTNMKKLIKESEQLEKANKQLEIYQGFIKTYKAEKTLEKYITDQQTANKDSNGLYHYEMLYRPCAIGCQPKGFIAYDETKGNRHGVITYNRPLTQSELDEYELREFAAQ